jgi:ribose transport system substrate-binding protein
MEAKYLDVGTIYDAFAHSKEAIRVAVRILTGKPVDCPEAICLAKGRVTTQENIATIENLWSRQ